REAFGAVKEAYEAATPAVTLVFSFDASSALRAQVEQGAPVDVFASADARNPRILAEAGLTSGEPLAFAGNRLAIVVPAANPARIASPVDLARPDVRLVSAGPEVPITSYTAKMLSNLARLPGYPERYVAAVSANVVSREDNVKAVLAKVQLGEGDAGVVYATDAKAAGDDVRTIPIPDEANVVATYAAVVPKDAPHPAAAASFLAWLRGPDGMAVLARFGFTAPAS
ncbi:MAG: molybdate ABC transporter substrate-binding protein, partial [Chloroflexota bacterium]